MYAGEQALPTSTTPTERYNRHVHALHLGRCSPARLCVAVAGEARSVSVSPETRIRALTHELEQLLDKLFAEGLDSLVNRIDEAIRIEKTWNPDFFIDGNGGQV